MRSCTFHHPSFASLAVPSASLADRLSCGKSVLRTHTQQERPCTRCIKRNIGHLCHDEPRDSESKKTKSVLEGSTVDESASQSDIRSSIDQSANAMGPPSFDAGAGQASKSAFNAGALGRSNPLQLVQPTPVTGIQPNAINTGNANQCRPLPCCPLSHHP